MSAEQPSPSISETTQFHTSDKTLRFLERMRFSSLKETDQQNFEAWLQNLDFSTACKYLTYLNNLFRDLPFSQSGFDGETVTISTVNKSDWDTDTFINYLPPDYDLKAPLLQEVFTALKKIPDNQDRGLLAYYSLQALHLFNDGNGRLGRLIYKLFTQETAAWSKEKLKALLDHPFAEESSQVATGRKDFASEVITFDQANNLIIPELAKQIFGPQLMQNFDSIKNCHTFLSLEETKNYLSYLKDQLSPTNYKQLAAILAENNFGETNAIISFSDLILLLLSKNHPQLIRPYLSTRKYPFTPKKDSASATITKHILFIDLEQILTDQIITPDLAQEIILLNRQIKTNYLSTLTDIFSHPDQHQTNQKGQKIALKDLFTSQPPSITV